MRISMTALKYCRGCLADVMTWANHLTCRIHAMLHLLGLPGTRVTQCWFETTCLICSELDAHNISIAKQRLSHVTSALIGLAPRAENDATNCNGLVILLDGLSFVHACCLIWLYFGFCANRMQWFFMLTRMFSFTPLLCYR